MSIKNKPQKKKNPTLAAKNPAFKWWAVPHKKGTLSKGLKVKPKQVKKV